MRIHAVIGATLLLCSTASAASSAPISYVVSPSSGTLTVGDTVTVTFSFDPSELVYPVWAEALEYATSVYFDDRYFAFTSRSPITADAADAVYLDTGTSGAHNAYSLFIYDDLPAFRGAFTYSETFTAIGGTPEFDVLTGFQPAAAARYQSGPILTTVINVGAFEYYDVTPHVPEPGVLALSSIAFTAVIARRARKRRTH